MHSNQEATAAYFGMSCKGPSLRRSTPSRSTPFVSLGGCKRLKNKSPWSAISPRWTCSSTHVQPSWRGRLRCASMIYSSSLPMVRLREFVLTRDVSPPPAGVQLLRRVPGSNMQPPPAAAWAPLLGGLLLSLDLLSAVQPQPNRRDVPNHESGAKKQQPHIVFILIDDQVGVRARAARAPAVASRGRRAASLLIQLVTP